MLNSLTITNFKKHDHLEVEFSPKLTLIQGKNYQGKSTILHAIMYALGGARFVPGGKGVVKTKGCGKPETVDLRFSVGGDEYRVFRSGSNATLYKRGEPEATGTSPVNSEIEKILGMSLRMFCLTHYSEQSAAKLLVEMGAPALNRLLEEACEVDLVDSILAKLKDLQTELSARVDMLQVGDIAELRTTVETAKAELKVSTSSVETAKSIRAAATEERDRCEAMLTNAESLLNSAKTAQAAVNSCTDRLSGLETQLAALGAVVDSAGLSDEVDRKEAAVRLLEEQQTKAIKLRARVKALESELSGLRADRDKLEAELSSLPEPGDTSDLGSKLEADKARLTLAKQAVSNAKSTLASGVCQACLRPHENFDKDEASKAVEKAETEYKKWADSVSWAQDKLAFLVAANKNYKKVLGNLESVVTSIEYAAEELDNIICPEEPDKSALEELRESLLYAKRMYVNAVKAETMRKMLTSQVEEAKDNLNDAKAELAALPNTSWIDLPAFSSAASAARKMLQEAVDNFTSASINLGHKTSEYMRMQAELARAEKTVADRALLEKKMGVSTRLSKFLRDNRSRFMDTLWGTITGAASDMLQACTNGAVTAVTRDQEGEFTYTEAGEEMPIAAASGAQKALIGTALKQAMKTAMPAGMPVSLLDEITADMDADHAFAVSNYLASSGEQIVAISHREQDGFAADVQVVL